MAMIHALALMNDTCHSIGLIALNPNNFIYTVKMNEVASEFKKKPSVFCQHGKNCQQTSPEHFLEYAHEHLDQIILSNPTTNEVESYEIPDGLIVQKDLYLEQIKVIHELFSEISLGSDPKEKNPAENSTQVSTSSKVSSADNEEADELPTASPNFWEELDIRDFIKVVQKGEMAEKLAKSRPYNFFLTCITSSPKTHDDPLSITFQEILDPSLGELEQSIQITFIIDADWLLGQYYFTGNLNKPLFILYGKKSSRLEEILQVKPNITAHLVEMRSQFDIHHSKIMLLSYTDGSMRVVIATANLVAAEWDNIADGLWMSEKLEPLSEGSDTMAGESATGFRKELCTYLSSYKLEQLKPWLERIQKTNFKSVNVFLVTSIPGVYNNVYPHGHPRVGQLLSKHSAPIPEDSVIVAQTSSLGMYGKKPDQWLDKAFIESFRNDSQTSGWRDRRRRPNLNIIYPSHKNVEDSHEGLSGGEYLGYQKRFHQMQQWLNEYLYQWRADCRHRSQAVPHIKTYCRWSEKKLYWFMLTSANLSKAAWGSLYKGQFYNRNYEAGVIFFPKFITDTTYFSMDDTDKSTPVFPAVYDIPLTKYDKDDIPFFMDVLYDDGEDQEEDNK